MFDMPRKPYWLYALAQWPLYYRLGLTLAVLVGMIVLWLCLIYFPLSFFIAKYERQVQYEHTRLAEINKARADIARLAQQHDEKKDQNNVSEIRIESPLARLIKKMQECKLQVLQISQSNMVDTNVQENQLHLEANGSLSNMVQLFSLFSQEAEPFKCNAVRLSGDQTGVFLLTFEISE